MATLNKEILKLENGSVLDSLYRKLVAGLEKNEKETLPDFTGPDYQTEVNGVMVPDEGKINKDIADFSSIMRKNTAYLFASAIAIGGGEGFLPIFGGKMEGKLEALYGFEAGDRGKAYLSCYQDNSDPKRPRKITRISSELHLDPGSIYMDDKEVVKYNHGVLTFNASRIVFNGETNISGGGGGSFDPYLIRVQNIQSLNYVKRTQGFGILTDTDGSGVIEADKLYLRRYAEFGNYEEGRSGAIIDGSGLSEFEAVTARSSVTSPVLSSPYFVSGFPNGMGYQLSPYKRINAAGGEETRYRLEIDDLVVRGVFRVFEMIVSQLRGENDNVIFAGMMKVEKIDKAKKIIYLDTNNGGEYNPFRAGDILMVQRFNGLPSEGRDFTVIKQYELTVVEAFVGDLTEGEKRLDYITYKDFVGDIDSVAKGDTLTRVDSKTDSTRKGIVKVTTIDEAGAPYIDVVYGMKTDPVDSTKARLGRLEGLTTPYWGQLKGYGLMASNAYLKGRFVLHNGEDVLTKFQIVDGKIDSTISSLRTEINAKDNYLNNASFSQNTEYWEALNDIQFFTVQGRFLFFNDNFYAEKHNVAAVVNDGKYYALRLKNSSVIQTNANLANNKVEQVVLPGGTTESGEILDRKEWPNFYVSFRYKCITPGTLTIGFIGSEISETISLTPVDEFVVHEFKGKWDGTGDFKIQFTGDIYIMSLVLTNRPLEDFRTSYETKVLQTDKQILLQAEKHEELTKTVTQLGLDINAERERVDLYIDKTDTLSGDITNMGLRLDGYNETVSLYITKTNDLSQAVTNLGVQIDGYDESVRLYAEQLSENNSALSELKVSVGNISSTVSSASGNASEAKRLAGLAQDAANQAAADASTALSDASTAKTNAATAITQSAQAVAIWSGNFDENGNVLDSSSLVVKSDIAALKTTVEGHTASLTTCVTYDPNTNQMMSKVKISADQVDLDGKVTFSMFSNDLQKTVATKSDLEGIGLTQQERDKIENAMSEKTYISGGYLVTSLAKIKEIEAVTGTIGAFNIDSKGLYNTNTSSGAYIKIGEDGVLFGNSFSVNTGSSWMHVASEESCTLSVSNYLKDGIAIESWGDVLLQGDVTVTKNSQMDGDVNINGGLTCHSNLTLGNGIQFTSKPMQGDYSTIGKTYNIGISGTFWINGLQYNHGGDLWFVNGILTNVTHN